MSRINQSAANVRMNYDEITGKFSLQSQATGFVNKIRIEGEADSVLTFWASTLTNRQEEGGQDAIYTMNGTKIHSADNTITKNGMTITLNQTHQKYRWYN